MLPVHFRPRRLMVLAAAALLLLPATALGSVTFNPTGGVQQIVVPAGSNTATINARGATGTNSVNFRPSSCGGGSFNQNGGWGGDVTGTVPVTAGRTLYVLVGGIGDNIYQTPGYNGGGTGAHAGGSDYCLVESGGYGGGASDVRTDPADPATRLIVAGGGGGGGGTVNAPRSLDAHIFRGGSGVGTTTPVQGANGVNQASPNDDDTIGGGGGGYYGGTYSEGGSSYLEPSGWDWSAGWNTGDGFVPGSVTVTFGSIDAPRVTQRVSVTGTPQVGRTLTADPGAWTNHAYAYSYTWQRCTGSPSVCTTISGTPDADDHDATYTLTGDDLGAHVRVRVTARGAGGSTSNYSTTTPATRRGPAPVPTHRPTMSGTREVGHTLTADHGTWSNNPTSYTYTWQRCTTTDVASCTTITGTPDADDGDSTYTLTADDFATHIRVRVTASSPGNATSSASQLTASIGPKPVVTRRAAITGTDQVGQTLIADHGDWDNDPIGYVYTWQRCTGTSCTTISGTPDADDQDATYTLTGDDQGTRIRLKVTASNAAGSASDYSDSTPAVDPAP